MVQFQDYGHAHRPNQGEQWRGYIQTYPRPCSSYGAKPIQKRMVGKYNCIKLRHFGMLASEAKAVSKGYVYNLIRLRNSNLLGL